MADYSADERNVDTGESAELDDKSPETNEAGVLS